MTSDLQNTVLRLEPKASFRMALILSLALGVACGDDDAMTLVDAGPGTDAPRLDAPGTDTGGGEDTGGGGETIDVDADITTDTTWTRGNTYVLGAPIYVSGATLTIEPGTTIQGDGGPNALIVTTTGRLVADGTADAPIVFTSANPEGLRSPGDWGGIVLLGNASLNLPAGTNNIEGLDPGESRGQYGGDDDTHDCGTLRFVRIEWAGFLFGDDNELNGLTLGGCGSDTVLEHIQVHGGLDDGIEFFGGTANLKWAVVTQVGDDSLDWDQGYRGKVQFFVAQQSTGNRGIEADNLGDDETLTPRSAPLVSNITLIGADQAEQQGMRLRAGTAGHIRNALVTHFGMEDCVRVDGSVSIEQANAGDLSLVTSIVDGCADRDGVPSYFRFTPDEGDEVTTFTGDWTTPNSVGVDAMLPDPTNLDAPGWVPPAGSMAATLGGPAHEDAFFDTATYVGAFEPGGTDWTAGWTAFPILPE